MKQSQLWILILSTACVSGCLMTKVTEPADPFAYLDDPVARATGARWSWEPNKHYDAGIFLGRERLSNSARDRGTANLRMAFDVNSNPAQISGAALNRVLLPWIPSEQGLFHAQIYARDMDTDGFGAKDSATFSYAGYDGESWTEMIEIAPDFGDITSPDTVTISQGWTIRYQVPVPGDSIRVSINAILTDPSQQKKLPFESLALDETLPDTGVIVIPPEKLPHAPGIDTYILQVSRFHFNERTSPSGKRIGTYSEVDFPAFGYSVRP